jgi:hypothetical protein
VKKFEPFRQQVAREATVEVDKAAFVCQVLMAYKSPELKRRLGLGYGSGGAGYKDERQKAEKYVLDNAFNLAILWQLYTRGPFGLLRANAFKRAVERSTEIAKSARGAAVSSLPGVPDEPEGILGVKPVAGALGGQPDA